MNRYWTISIVIPGECFAKENRAERIVETKWVDPEPRDIDVEEVTSQFFPDGDDEGKDS
jgi:hypothetical protein